MRKYGFNFLWMFIWHEGQNPQEPNEKELDFVAEEGFNFVRVPTDYRYWIRDFDYHNPNEQVFEYIDSYLEACMERELHMCLNIHRAPGYCINRNDIEKHNLWLDSAAQEGFIFQWETFAKRYKGIPNQYLSFDLINEPPNIGQYGLTRENHADLMRRTAESIRAIDPERQIVIDGLGGGNIAMPELVDLGAVHSGRGYQPMAVTHYQASWWSDSADLPIPVYPGTNWAGTVWDKDTIRTYYEPWLAVQSQGVEVHIGEFGCYNKTPNDVALRWFSDLLSLYSEFGWGYSLWNFKGPFGIVEHGRPGVVYENYKGFKVDRELLEIYKAHRISSP